MECIKKEHGAEEKTEIHLSDAWNCRSFFYFSDYVSLFENFNPCSGKPRSILWNIIFAHTVYLQCAVCDRRNMDRGCSLEFRKICISIFEISKSVGEKRQLSFAGNRKEQNNTGTGNERKCGTVPELCSDITDCHRLAAEKIIFPVREYEEKELTTILYHELVHIRQHILEMKKMGIFLKLIFWCNPMMNGLLRSIDMWGEIACDRYVCSETAYPYTAQEYYTVAVDGLEQSHLWMPKMVTGFRKKSNFKSRILQMKNYKKENDFKRIGGITLVVFLCAVCTTTTLASGEGFKAGYERLFAQTKVEVEDVVVEETEYEENFDASKVTIVYDGNEEQLPQGNGDLTEQKLGKSEAAVWENIRISGQNMITVSLSNNPFENEVRYGLIMPDGKLRYVYGSGMCSHAFEVVSAGTYKIYVENVSSSSITVSGGYLYN